MKFLFHLLFFVMTVGLSSCAYTTSSEVTSADRYLKNNCKEAYLSSRTSVSSDGFGYQYHRYRVRAFAVANYGDTQVCGWWHGPWGTPQSEANLMAVNSCNQKLPRGLTCTVYAEDDRIVNSPPNYPVVTQSALINNIIEAKPVAAQAKLPVCQGSDISKWNNCFGTINYPEGAKYVGEFGNGQLNGKGTYTHSDGRKYVGEYRGNLAHGQGAVYGANGSIINQGIWEHGIFTRSELVQQVNIPNAEAVKLRAEADEAKRKQAEQERLRLSQNQPPAPLVLSAPTPATTHSMGKRLALVIGNQTYNVRPLLNPRNDADDMSRALKNAGFEVIDVRDASLSQMRNAVRQFGDRLLTRDVGLVYYSGHGIEVRGRNYFIPVNADIKRSDEIADQSLDVNLILEKMETAKKGVNILIVDACRDDPFGRSFRSSSKGLATMDAPQGTIIAFATSPGKVAADGEGRNSPYTKNLIKTMQIPNLPIEQVFKQVRRAVQQETKNQQTPWENTSLSGDFYFSVKK